MRHNVCCTRLPSQMYGRLNWAVQLRAANLSVNHAERVSQSNAHICLRLGTAFWQTLHSCHDDSEAEHAETGAHGNTTVHSDNAPWDEPPFPLQACTKPQHAIMSTAPDDKNKKVRNRKNRNGSSRAQAHAGAPPLHVRCPTGTFRITVRGPSSARVPRVPRHPDTQLDELRAPGRQHQTDMTTCHGAAGVFPRSYSLLMSHHIHF
jgi:hypothetical protein